MHLLKRCRRREAIRSIVSAQIQPGIPSGPDATSREAIFFTALMSSSLVISSSSLHSDALASSSSSLSEGRGRGISRALESRPLVSGTRFQLPCPAFPGPYSQSVQGGGLSLVRTTLYGRPPRSDSTDSINSFQDRFFAILISRCSNFLPL
jgi:hypothetical protein